MMRLSLIHRAGLVALRGRRGRLFSSMVGDQAHAASALASLDSSSSSSSASSSAGVEKPKTAVLMLNMGGPSTPEETGPFLTKLFTDNDIIELGGGTFQNMLGKFISKRRTPKVAEQYAQIGGSPIRKWTEYQGKKMCQILDEKCPESAPHKAYTAFRYANPLTEESLLQMKDDGVERVVAFSQFPQWSCTTTGSSMNELWRQVKNLGLEQQFKWSLIDRWPLHDGFINAVISRVEERMLDFPQEDRDKVVIVFSAHSLPMKVVEKGDHYVGEVAATVKQVMDRWNDRVRDGAIEGVRRPSKHVLAWQSKVGFLPWMVPSTSETIKNLVQVRGNKHMLIVPVAFTSDHIETLFEIGIEYAEEAEEMGVKNFKYCEGLNGSEEFAEALADIVANHLDRKELFSAQYKQKCLTCTKPLCRQLMNPAY
jgi:ferrochelatase